MFFRNCILIIALAICASCNLNPNGGFGPPPFPAPIFEGGDGSSYEQAVRFRRAKGNEVSAEFTWIHDRYLANLKPPPSVEDWDHNTHFVTERRGKKVYDVVTVILPHETHTFYFDVSRYRYYGNY